MTEGPRVLENAVDSTLAQGTLFAGRYKVVRRIAAGAMGAVYEVLHVETQRRRALKVMLAHALEDEDLRERFKLEARVAAQVESDFIVDVFDAGVDGDSGMPFLVMELLRGEELGRRIKRLGRLSARETVTYLTQTALALDKTHRAGIVHRDLKPGNLFLTEQDDGTRRIKILDFGVAKIMSEGALVSTATISVGTPFYMAPEQFLNEGVSPAADVYALGMIAYTLLVGAPYWGEELRAGTPPVVFATIAAKGAAEAATARAERKKVTLPPAFDAWFARVTAVSPAARFPTAGAAVASLAEAFALGETPKPQLEALDVDVSASGAVGASTSVAGPAQAAEAPDETVREAAVARPANVQPAPATSRALVIRIGVAAVVAFGIGGYLAMRPGSEAVTSPVVVSASPVSAPASPARSEDIRVEPAPSASAIEGGAPGATASPSASPSASASASRPDGRPSVAPPRQPPKTLYRRD